MKRNHINYRLAASGAAVLMAVGLCGCGPAADDDAAPSASDTPAVQSTDAPAVQPTEDPAAAENLAALRTAFQVKYSGGTAVQLADLDHDGMKDLVFEVAASDPASIHAMVVKDGAVQDLVLAKSEYTDPINWTNGLNYLVEEDPDTGYASLLEFRGCSGDGYGGTAFYPLHLDGDLNIVREEPFGYPVPEGGDPMSYPVNEEKKQELITLFKERLKDARTVAHNAYYQDDSLLAAVMPLKGRIDAIHQLEYEMEEIDLFDGVAVISVPTTWQGRYIMETSENAEMNARFVSFYCASSHDPDGPWYGTLMTAGLYAGRTADEIRAEDWPSLEFCADTPAGALAVSFPTDVQFDYTDEAAANDYMMMMDDQKVIVPVIKVK